MNDIDGTTDVTRTMHFGVPTAAQRDSYTRVLMGHADLARAVIPRTVKDTRTDLLARNPLYSVGLGYFDDLLFDLFSIYLCLL